MVWLFVMTLFPLSNLLLKFDRGRLSREPRTPILVLFTTFGIAFAVIGGNIALDPTTIGYVSKFFTLKNAWISINSVKQIFCCIFRGDCIHFLDNNEEREDCSLVLLAL